MARSNLKTSARAAAFLACLNAFKEDGYIEDFLKDWQQKENPSDKDFRLSLTISAGTCRKKLSLEMLAKQLLGKSKLPKKLKEKILLYTALYQWAEMDKIPLHALINESVELAKKYCSPHFASFLNAVLRNLPTFKPSAPLSLEEKFSFPAFFSNLLKEQQGVKTEELLNALNTPPKVQVRCRKSLQDSQYKLIAESPFQVAEITDSKDLQEIFKSPDFSVQNVTSATLIGLLAKNLKHTPKTILDLAAAPGGKLLAAHDCFPKATLFGNDVSPDKVDLLKQNFEKYQVPLTLSCGKGEEFQSDQKFDLIILDLPCSNTGVFHKRPEARWRLNEEKLKQLVSQQKAILARAVQFLAPEGTIWYMTCSILQEENDAVIKWALENSFVNEIDFVKTILPNLEGWDGGFAASLKL